MRSSQLGKNILEVEVLNVGPQGIWLFVREKEYFLDYKHFPWFRNAKLSEIFDVQLSHDHLYWPNLDVDLELDSLENPEKYPLIAKQ